MIEVGRRCACASASLQVLLFSCLLLAGSYAAFLLATISAQTATASLKAASMNIAIAAACAAALKFCTDFVATAKKIKSDVVAAHPLKMKVGKSGLALILVVLYWADVVTDLVLMHELLRTGNPVWGTLTAIFVASSYLLAYAAVLRYLHSRFGFRDWEAWPLWAFAVFGIVPVPLPFVSLAPLPGLPIGPLLLDMLMFVEAFPWVLHRLPLELQTFLSSYRASRKLIEVNAEATPQSVLQTYIFVRVSSFHANTNSFSVPVRLLVQSLSLSILNLGMVAWDVRSAMQISQLGLSAFLAQQFALGAGLPLDALRNNAIEAWKSPFMLDLSQIKMLASALKENASLTALDLSWNELGPEGGKALAPAIAASTSLTEVDVRMNNISGDGASQLSAAVLANSKIEKFNKVPIKEMRADSLTTLDMKDKYIGDEGGMVVAGLLPVMSSLTSLNLYYNSIRDEGITAICTAVKENKETKLAELNICNNSVTPVGAKSVAAMLADTASLTALDLSGNPLGPEGGKALAPAIAASTSLTALDLGYNELGPEGGKALAPAIAASTSLTALYLGDNELRAEGGKALAPAIAASASLTHISLEYNPLGEEGKAAIREAVRGKTGFKLEI